MTKHKSIRPAAAPEPLDEGTAVRPRTSEDPPTSGEQSSSARASERTVVLSGRERDQQLGDQVRRAQQLLTRLPANDRRRRLLHAAIVRRDEMLLSGFLDEFDSE